MKKINKTKLITTVFIIAVLLSSIVYLDYTKIDYEHERDAYQIGLEISKRASGINDYHPEVKFIHNKINDVANLGTFPIVSSDIEKKVKLIRTYDRTLCYEENALETGCRQYDYSSLNEFIDYGKNEGLTHIIADGNENRAQFINDVFENEEKFPYLTKIYDSSEHGFDYHLKIFEIGYEEFESMK